MHVLLQIWADGSSVFVFVNLMNELCDFNNLSTECTRIKNHLENIQITVYICRLKGKLLMISFKNYIS